MTVNELAAFIDAKCDEDEFERHMQSMRADARKDADKHGGSRAGVLGKKLNREVVEEDGEYYLLMQVNHEEVKGA